MTADDESDRNPDPVDRPDTGFEWVYGWCLFRVVLPVGDTVSFVAESWRAGVEQMRRLQRRR